MDKRSNTNVFNILIKYTQILQRKENIESMTIKVKKRRDTVAQREGALPDAINKCSRRNSKHWSREVDPDVHRLKHDLMKGNRKSNLAKWKQRVLRGRPSPESFLEAKNIDGFQAFRTVTTEFDRARLGEIERVGRVIDDRSRGRGSPFEMLRETDVEERTDASCLLSCLTTELG